MTPIGSQHARDKGFDTHRLHQESVTESNHPPGRDADTNPRMNQTWATVLLSTAAALLGTVLGGVLDSTIDGVTDPSGWGPLIGAIFGIMLGVPLAEVTLAFL